MAGVTPSIAGGASSPGVSAGEQRTGLYIGLGGLALITSVCLRGRLLCVISLRFR